MAGLKTMSRWTRSAGTTTPPATGRYLTWTGGRGHIDSTVRPKQLAGTRETAMNYTKALLVVPVLTVVVVLFSGVGRSAPPTAASKPVASQPAYPLWDGNESVADYAKRAGIKDVQIALTLDGNVTLKL